MTKTEIDFILHTPRSNKLKYYGKHFRISSESFILKQILTSCFFFIASMIVSICKYSNWKRSDIILSDSKKNEDILRLYEAVEIAALPGKNTGTNLKVSWIYFYSFFIHLIVEYGSYNYLNSIHFSKRLDYFFQLYCSFLTENKVIAVNLNADMTFFQRFAILVCRYKNIPSYQTPHGYPALWNDFDYNQTDYLFISGIELQKVINSKFPSFQKKILKSKNKFDTHNFVETEFSTKSILVLSKSLCGADFSDKKRLSSRESSLIYLEEIKETLLSFNIKNVNLRLHPSENRNWYKKFIDINFFTISINTALDDISNSDLIIGPTSSFLFDAFYGNRNYLIFEPQVNGVDILNYETYPPFDGSVKEIYVAKSKDELAHLIENKCVNSNKVIGDFNF